MSSKVTEQGGLYWVSGLNGDNIITMQGSIFLTKGDLHRMLELLGEVDNVKVD